MEWLAEFFTEEALKKHGVGIAVGMAIIITLVKRGTIKIVDKAQDLINVGLIKDNARLQAEVSSYKASVKRLEASNSRHRANELARNNGE